jgi:hypothetical protein
VIKLFLFEQTVTREQLEDFQNRLTGVPEEGERITLRVRGGGVAVAGWYRWMRRISAVRMVLESAAGGVYWPCCWCLKMGQENRDKTVMFSLKCHC